MSSHSPKRYREIVDLTATCASGTQALLTGDSDYAFEIYKVVAANQDNYANAITLYEESDQFTPQMAVGASGTLFWEEDNTYSLGIGSGLYGCILTSGTFEVAVYYGKRDESAGITKSAARTATYVASKVTRATRAPNKFGGQQEG